MKGEPGGAAENDHVAGTQANRPGRLVAVQAADPKQTGITERNRDHRCVEIRFVAILMQTHLCAWAIEVDQTSLGRVLISGKLAPYRNECRGYRRPGFP